MFWERVRYVFLTKISFTKPVNVALWVAGVLSSFITIFGSEENRPSKESLLLILFLSAIGGLIYVICTRWVKLKVYIPPNRKEAREYEGKVMLSMTDILAPFEKEERKHYDIALAYNSNNIVGGKMKDNHMNLMGQFLCRYFHVEGAQDENGFARFNVELFKECLLNENTKAYCLKQENGENVLEKIPKERYADNLWNAQGNVGGMDVPGMVFPWRSGTVIALKLPEEADRDYVYLMCSTRYDGNLRSPHSDEIEQKLCLECLWKVVKELHENDLSSCIVSIPFINKGYSNMGQNIHYSVLWNILHSYKLATVDFRNNGCDVGEKFAVAIHIPRDVFKTHGLNMAEVLRFLKYALVS